MNRFVLYAILLFAPLGLSCDMHPTAPSAQAQTYITSFVPAETEYQGERRRVDSSGIFSWQHPDGIGGRQTIGIVTDNDSILITVDIRDDREKNHITIYHR